MPPVKFELKTLESPTLFFTIASADHGDGVVSFHIKALGDYTGRLAERLRPGEAVRVEGPYGRFDLERRNRRARQIWIAGGIGVTPFLAWLESLQADPANAPEADLHYCTRDQATDAFVPRLEALCAALPGVRLHIHGAHCAKADHLAAVEVDDAPRPVRNVELVSFRAGSGD